MSQMSMVLMGEMFLYAKTMGNRSGVLIVRTGIHIERITAEMLSDAFEKWTTSAPGQFALHILWLSFAICGSFL